MWCVWYAVIKSWGLYVIQIYLDVGYYKTPEHINDKANRLRMHVNPFMANSIDPDEKYRNKYT